MKYSTIQLAVCIVPVFFLGRKRGKQNSSYTTSDLCQKMFKKYLSDTLTRENQKCCTIKVNVHLERCFQFSICNSVNTHRTPTTYISMEKKKSK